MLVYISKGLVYLDACRLTYKTRINISLKGSLECSTSFLYVKKSYLMLSAMEFHSLCHKSIPFPKNSQPQNANLVQNKSSAVRIICILRDYSVYHEDSASF